MQQRARANKAGSTNWNIYTYNAHKVLTILYLVEYACTNSQKAFNAELTAEGYHQGGLGDGVTTGSIQVNGVAKYNFIPCGSTDEHGNSTGITSVTVDSSNAEGVVTQKTYNVPTYRGIENPFGHVWKNCIDILIHYNATSTKNDVYVTTDVSKFGSTNVSDYNYTNNSTSDRTLFVGGHSGHGTNSGLLSLGSYIALGTAYASVGTRLIYIP